MMAAVRRSGRSRMAFGRSGLTLRPPGQWQRHHLIPRCLGHDAELAALIALTSRHGRPLDRFDSNGIWLPGSEADAERTGLPLHRGPHPRYTDLVRARMVAIARGPSEQALERLAWLRAALSRSLSAGRRLTLLNHRDPMSRSVNFSALDSAIDHIWSATAPPAFLGQPDRTPSQNSSG